MDQDNPIEQSINWLIEQGFDRNQSTNLCRAIYAATPEKLWQDAPVWLEWCGKVKREHDCVVMLAAMGTINVELGPGGIEDLRIKLKDEILQARKQDPQQGRSA